MNKGIIGTNAGLLWRIMDNSHDQQHWSYKKLQQATELSDEDLYAALGWLARENKIEFRKDTVSGEDRIFLNVCYYF